MTLPSIQSWSAREVVTGAKLNNQIRDVNRFLTSPPYAKCRRNSTLSITGGTIAKFPWNSASTRGITANGTGSNIASLTIQQKGLYYVNCAIGGQPNTNVSHFMIDICVNGSAQLRGICTAEDVSYQDTAFASGLLLLNAGDIVSTEVYVSASRSADFASGTWQQDTCVLSLNWTGRF